jgi:hypothetical protein
MLKKQPKVIQDKNGAKRVETINYCFDEIYLGAKLRDKSDYGIPKDIYDALEGSKSKTLVQPTVQEAIINSLSRNAGRN